MKRYALTACLLLAACAAFGTTLRPSVIVYGSVRDEYGTRMHSGVQISIYRGTKEIARTFASAYPDGVCYRLSLDVFDPTTATADQLKPGDQVQVWAKVGNAFQPLIGATSFTISGDGEAARVDLLMGVDSDGDGIPDAWEQMVVANSGGGASGINDVGPGRDLDGDGMTDDQEFWYGSFAFLPGDQLRFDDFDSVGDRFRFRFLTVAAAVYRLEMTSPSPPNPQWGICPIAMDATSPVAPVEFAGNGDFINIYVEGLNRAALYRLKAR